MPTAAAMAARNKWPLYVFLCIYMLSLVVVVDGAPTTMTYSFDKAHAGGVAGSITVMYDSPQSSTVTITTNIDMRSLDMAQVLASHPECEPNIQEYKWYLVVNNVGVVPLVGFLEKCDVVDGPQDFYTTDHNEDDTRCNKTVAQNLNLSSKLGRLVVHNGRIAQTWHNVPFPPYDQVTPRWSIVLNAVCGDTSPPVVCARVDFELTASNNHVHRKEAHGIVGVAAFVLASSLLLFLS